MDETETARPRRRRRKEARPGEIIEAGLQVFAEKGFAGARLDDIAERAGIAKGTIYRYFDSKEALFEAAVRSRLIPAFEGITGRVEAWPGSSADLLRLVLATFYARVIDSDLRELLRIIIAEGPRFPALLEFYHAHAVTFGKTLLTRIIERGIERGEFRESAARALPQVVMGPAIMAAVWKMTFDRLEPIPIDRFLDAHIDLVLNGLLLPEREVPGEPPQRA